MMQPLKLIALDAEDLAIISAHLQDAVMRLDDIAFVPKQSRFAIVLNRFDWPTALGDVGTQLPANERCRSAIRFERVRAVRQREIPLQTPAAVLSLLAVTFEPTELPAGKINLLFAGGGAIQLDVECIEAELRDLGAVWATQSRPNHESDLSEASPPELSRTAKQMGS